MYVDALVKHIVTYLWNQRFLTQKCVNTAYLSRKWVNTAFLLHKFVNTAFFVAKFCKYALIDSFQGYPAVVDSSTSCAALILTNFFVQNVQGLSTGHKTFLRNRNWSPNKKVMTDMVILYHFLKGLFEQCDIKSLEDSCTTLVSARV